MDAPLGAGVLVVCDELDGTSASLRDRGVVLQGKRPASCYCQCRTPQKPSQRLQVHPKTTNTMVTARFSRSVECDT